MLHDHPFSAAVLGRRTVVSQGNRKSIRAQEGRTLDRPSDRNLARPAARSVADFREKGVHYGVPDAAVVFDAPSHQDQVFGLFTRLHAERYQGTGVGLAVVRKGVERMGGRVGRDSASGHGSCFWIELRKV